MKKTKGILLFTVTAVLLVSSAACSSTSGSGSGQPGASAPQPVTIVEAATVEQNLDQADQFITVDKLLGSWTDVTSPDRFVSITQSGSDYQYEDNEGKYPAAFANGKLTIRISDTDSAEVYLDSKTGHLMSVYKDNISEYKKK